MLEVCCGWSASTVSAHCLEKMLAHRLKRLNSNAHSNRAAKDLRRCWCRSGRASSGSSPIRLKQVQISQVTQGQTVIQRLCRTRAQYRVEHTSLTRPDKNVHSGRFSGGVYGATDAGVLTRRRQPCSLPACAVPYPARQRGQCGSCWRAHRPAHRSSPLHPRHTRAQQRAHPRERRPACFQLAVFSLRSQLVVGTSHPVHTVFLPQKFAEQHARWLSPPPRRNGYHYPLLR